MKKNRYVTRTQLTCTVGNSTMELLNDLSEKTGKSRSKVLDAAVELFNEKFKDDQIKNS